MVEKELDVGLVRRAAAGYFHEPFTLGDVPKHWSTHVYAVYSGGKTYYLRVSNESTSLAIEVKVHEMMQAIDVTVPRVLHFEHKNEHVGLSLMIEEEIPGASIEREPPAENLEQILRDAGRQIALANQIPVDGFDELDRSYYDVLRGKARTFAEFFLAPLANNIKALASYPFTTAEIDRIVRIYRY